jgi:hypothetical protein
MLLPGKTIEQFVKIHVLAQPALVVVVIVIVDNDATHSEAVRFFGLVERSNPRFGQCWSEWTHGPHR